MFFEYCFATFLLFSPSFSLPNSISKSINSNPNDLSIHSTKKVKSDTYIKILCKNSASEFACLKACFQWDENSIGKCNEKYVCICETKFGKKIQLKLLKGKTESRKLYSGRIDQSGISGRKISPKQELKLEKHGNFQLKGFKCNGNITDERICNEFCQSLTSSKQNLKGECSSDREQCICTSKPVQKNGKYARITRSLHENIIEKRGGVSLDRRLRRRRPPFRRPPFGDGPGLMSSMIGCNPMSCVGKCPPGCDSMCTSSLQCLCSCPEDEVFYDYFYDTPLFTDTLTYY